MHCIAPMLHWIPPNAVAHRHRGKTQAVQLAQRAAESARNVARTLEG